MATELPSRQFKIRGAIALGILIIVLVVQTSWFRGIFKKDVKTADIGEQTIGETVEKDSNGNGIPDWEERLWGLDPAVLYTGDLSNREIIEQKRLALGGGSAATNETDRLARDIFTVTTAIGENGEMTIEGLGSLADELGESVNIKPIGSKYSLQSIKTVPTSIPALRTYRNNVQAVLSKHQANVPEIDVVINGLETGDFSSLPVLNQTGYTYKELSDQLSKVSVPIGVASYHLNIINGLYGISESFEYLVQIEDNSVVGLAGLAAYRTFSHRTDYAIMELSDYLRDYGIL